MKIYFALCCLVLLFEMSECMTLALAGYSEKKPATEEIQKVADQVKKEFRKTLWLSMDTYRAENYWEKNDDGTTYLIEIKVASHSVLNSFLDFFTIEVHKPLGRRKARFKGIVERGVRKVELNEFTTEALFLEAPTQPSLPLTPNDNEYSDFKNATEEIQKMLEQVKVEGERKLNRRGDMHSLTEWGPFHYRTQKVPTGTFYEILVKTDPLTLSIVVIMKKKNGKLKLHDAYAAIVMDTFEMFAPGNS